MSVLVIDVGGDNFDLDNWERAGQAPPVRVGDFSRSSSGAKRSHIREELQVVPMVTGPVSTADHDAIYGYFALGARVDCQGTCFSPVTGVVTCTGDVTSEMVPGGVDDDGLPMWIVNLTLEVISTAGGGLGGMPLSVSPDDPLPASDIFFHYDAQALVGLSDEDEMTIWPDTDNPGAAHDASAGSVSPFDPRYDAAAMNSLPAVRFDSYSGNGRGFLLPAAFDPTEGGEAFLVLRASNGGGGAFWHLGPPTFGPNCPATATGTFKDHFGSSVQRSFTLGIDPTLPFLYHVRARDGLWQCSINGVPRYTSSSNTLTWGTDAFGVWYGPVIVTQFLGWIGELELRSGLLSDADAVTKESAYLTKWGIT